MAFTKKIAGWVAGRISGEKARKDTMRWMEKTGLGMILDAAGDYALAQGALKGAGALKGLLTGSGQTAQAAQAAQAAQQTQAAIAAGPKPSASLISGSVPPTPARAISQAAATPSPASLGMNVAKAAPAAVTPPAVFQPSAAGQAASRAIGGMTPPAPSPMQAMVAPPATPPMGGGMTPNMTATAQRMGGIENVANANIAGGPGGFRGAAQFARENAGWLGPAATAGANVLGQRGEQDVAMRKLDIEEQLRKEEQARRDRLAQLLMPMFQSQVQQYGQRPQG